LLNDGRAADVGDGDGDRAAVPSRSADGRSRHPAQEADPARAAPRVLPESGEVLQSASRIEELVAVDVCVRRHGR
jgi:hypothetical protein